ncbi:FMN-dependent NADH-azoreductase [Marinomonas transparens]|uniref:FMN dependent NADH:quinone oxidoreductase n=1 Tax=Marinomonas transparens TaxID=2795388 RepID=A0A934JUV6_9GAMM|nr:NAD(P)H-dependent oxidoreductase [Marinomonas transparens]MBJ7537477.1 NAD(P)H-dependent oxidoreductase [Marinomonas transparens]
MINVLILNSSPTPKSSISTKFTSFFEQKLLAVKGFNIVTRDLGVAPPSHLDELVLSGFFNDPSEHNEDQKKALSEGLILIRELEQADIVIIGAAMHNHTVTSGLKAYIDQVTRPGLTFQYKEDGPHGLLTNKQAFIIISAGGDYSSEETQKTDFVTPFLREVLGFIGLDEITFIPVFGTYLGSEVSEKNQSIARQTIMEQVMKLNQKR